VTSGDKYIVACSIVTFILTAVVVLAHFNPISASIFVQTKVEGVCIVVLVVFWSAIVALATDAGLSVAEPEDPGNKVQNANLYYFSWAGFVTSVILLVTFMRAAFGFDAVGELQSRAKRLQWWAALLATSVVVLGASTSSHRRDCGEDSEGGFDDSYCRKAKLGMAAGSLGLVFACLVIVTKVFQYSQTPSPTPFVLELGTAVFLTIVMGFNVAYVTSANAPGSAIGNLYYFSWGCFLISATLTGQCIDEYLNPALVDDKPSENGHSGYEGNGQNGFRGGDIEVETFDDNI
jgi:hypothetical protein